MLTAHDIEGFRRSAAMAPLSHDSTMAVLDECARLLREREQIATVLTDLPSSFAAVRVALNELQRLVQP